MTTAIKRRYGPIHQEKIKKNSHNTASASPINEMWKSKRTNKEVECSCKCGRKDKVVNHNRLQPCLKTVAKAFIALSSNAIV